MKKIGLHHSFSYLGLFLFLNFLSTYSDQADIFQVSSIFMAKKNKVDKVVMSWSTPQQSWIRT